MTIEHGSVADHVAHLAPDGRVNLHPGGALFWRRLMGGELAELDTGRVVTSGESSADWDSWEMHPAGDEFVLLLSGRAELLVKAADGSRAQEVVALDGAGAFAVVPRGCWHTLRVLSPCRTLFITAGAGTQHRPLAVA